MKRRLVLFGFFLAGALLMGVGGGIAFGEYSSFRYLGETRVGREHMVTETLSVTRDPEKPFSIETGGWNWQNVHVETDSTLPDDTLVFQVEYNEMAVTPYIEREKSGMNRERFFLWSDVNGDLEVLWECKDELLEDLKQRSFHSYEIAYWGDVTVRMSEQAAGLLENRDFFH